MKHMVSCQGDEYVRSNQTTYFTLIALSYPDDMSTFGLYGQKETDFNAERGATEKSVL
jgi:hypothetical protein